MKTGIYTILGIIGIILFVVMFMALSSVSGIVPIDKKIESTNDLGDYLPDNSSVWEYSDGKSFRKLMVTERLYESEKFIHLVVKGEEDDRSIKSFRDRYQFEYTYKVDDEKIIRSLKGQTLLDSYPQVTLLKLPLIVDNRWKDTWTGKNETSYSVTSTIKSIDNGGERIIIESVERNDNFVVTRILELGKGVVEVNISENYNGLSFETGFRLLNFEPFDNEGFDNYMALIGNEKIGTAIDTIDSKVDTSDVKDMAVASEVDASEEASIQENDEIEESIKIEIIESVKLFNDKWIKFINEGDMSIMDTITPNASVETIIEAYMNKEMTQSFINMEFKRIVLQGKVANAYVYEEIERTMDGVTEILIYNWIYEIDEVDGKWLVEGYIENENPQ